MCTDGQAGVRYVITKFSRMDSLPNFVIHGAPLRVPRAGAPLKTFINNQDSTRALCLAERCVCMRVCKANVLNEKKPFLESIFIAKRVSSALYRNGPTFARETFLLGYLWYAQL